jgi:predicted DCC family thiol-disulfide oxidoreductase YuxK
MKNFCAHISEPTEMSETCGADLARLRPGDRTAVRRRGWIFYDGQCRYCTTAARAWLRIFGRRGFEFLPLQTPWVQRRLGLDPDAPPEEMRVLTVANEDLGGADAVIYLARQIWWTRPIAWLAGLPGMSGLLDRGYRWIARHRGCTHIKCGLPGAGAAAVAAMVRPTTQSVKQAAGTTGLPWLGLVVLPTIALFLRPWVAPWIFMWAMAGALFLGCKWLTFWRAKQKGATASAGRVFGFFFLWAGMDATAFLGTRTTQRTVTESAGRAAFALIKIGAGTFVLFELARFAAHPLLAGWIGMIALILILHFGLFDLVATAWQSIGIAAKPIMNAPIKSTSLNEFWGRRWNGAFNQLVLDLFFRPLSRTVGSIRATLTTFLISGLIHELVISLPAGGGYGLPTGYFLLQGWGVVAQRSAYGRKWGLRGGIRGWLFTMMIAAGPAFWLFHPPFVRHVIIPFLRAVHAL